MPATARTPGTGGGQVESALRSALWGLPTVAVAEDLEAVIAEGALAHRRALDDPRPGVADRAWAMGLAAAHAAAARLDRPTAGLVDLDEDEGPGWLASAGIVVPVLGAAPGAGASVLAATLFDALAAAGLAVLLVDGADPARSGLAEAATEGPPFRQPRADVAISYGRRGSGFVARLSLPTSSVFSAGLVPPPPWWLPTSRSPQVTVVDLGCDPWPWAAAPLRGPGAWLQTSPSAPESSRQRPVLVCRPSRPSVAAAEQVLARLRPWVHTDQVVGPELLAVSGATRWPRGVAGAAGRELDRLGDARFVPADRDVAVNGIGPGPVSRPLRRAATRIADALDLL